MLGTWIQLTDASLSK